MSVASAFTDPATGCTVTIADNDMANCPADSLGSYPEGNSTYPARCRPFRVDCPSAQLPAITGHLAMNQPAAPEATMVLHFGGTGTKWFNNGFVSRYILRGFRVIQIKWDEPGWPNANGLGVKLAAMRPAALLNAIFQSSNYHGGRRDLGYCAHGHSGGSAALAYSVAHYQREDILDFVLFDAGPVTSDLENGCEPPGGVTTRPVCTGLTRRYAYSNGGLINGWENTTTCGTPYGDASATDRATWRRDGVVSSGATYVYPRTRLRFWYCAEPKANEAIGQGHVFVDQVLALNPGAQVSCENPDGLTGGCMVEPPWNGTATTGPLAGNTVKANMANAADAECVPRH